MKRTLDSKENTRLVKWLKQVRKEKGLSTTELGLLLDAPHTLISKVEQQERRLDVVEYLAYCKALDTDPTEGLNVINGKSSNKV